MIHLSRFREMTLAKAFSRRQPNPYLLNTTGLGYNLLY